MRVYRHSTVGEGTVTGLIGALIVAAWYFILDTAEGQPLHTPNVLGKIFFRGDFAPGLRQIMPPLVIGYTIVHVMTFVLAGMGLTLLVHMASRNIALRMGVWIGLVVAFGLFAGLTYMVGVASGDRLSTWSVVSASLFGVLGMGGYLWRRHPRLGRSFHEAPLGDEVRPPPHPSVGPRTV
jgi:hypothetical protein